jgi:putative spermidine/putrescine transport system substrate-binding protein
MKPQRLRILSWAGIWGQSLEDAVSRPFTEKTGIAIEHVKHVGLRLPESLGAALMQGWASPVDVVWCNNTPAYRAAASGWCEPLDSLPLEPLHSRAKPEGVSGWPFVKPYSVPYVLVYDKRRYPVKPPSSWEVLFDASHEGRVVLYPHGKGFFPIAQLLGGGALSDIPSDMSFAWKALRRLGPQLGPADYSIGLHQRFSQGDIHLCYRALPNALAFIRDGLPVGWTAPAEGVADTTDAFWVPRGLPEGTSEWAKAYVAFALSEAVQERWCSLLGAVPMHRGAALPPVLRPTQHKPLPLSEQVEASCEGDWERAFLATAGPFPRPTGEARDGLPKE